VVFGSTQTDISSLIRDVLPPELLAEYGTSPYGYGWGELPLLTVYGPLGLTVFTATAEDLGLTEVDVRELSGGGPDPTTLWTSNDGETWSMTELDLSYVNNVFDTGGELIAAGFGRSGAEIWTSPDGFEWTRESSTKSEFLARWRDGFVAGIEGPATGVSYSEDLSDWVSLGLAAYLGDDLSWQVNSLAASEGGVAVALWGYDEGGSFTGDPEPVAIDKGVYTLTVDQLKNRKNCYIRHNHPEWSL
jgi:hypothetical protein